MIQASIVSPRLALTPMTADDTEDLALIAGDGSVFRYIPDVALPFDSGRWVRSMLANEGQLVRHVIRTRQSREPVGFLQVSLRRNGDLQIGYFLARRFWGQRLAREACEAVRTFIVSAGFRRPLHAAAHRDNQASLRVLAALGFEPLAQPGYLSGVRPEMIDHVWHPLPVEREDALIRGGTVV